MILTQLSILIANIYLVNQVYFYIIPGHILILYVNHFC